MTLSGTGAVSESTRKLYESQLVTRRCPLIFILLYFCERFTRFIWN